jgi:hypothetical protein
LSLKLGNLGPGCRLILRHKGLKETKVACGEYELDLEIIGWTCGALKRVSSLSCIKGLILYAVYAMAQALLA